MEETTKHEEAGVMKYILLFVFALMTVSCFSQKSWADETFYKPCDKGEIKWDTISLHNRTIRYFFVAKNYHHTENNTHHFDGIVLIEIDKNNEDSLSTRRMAYAISNKIHLEQFYVLTSCQALRIFHSSLQPTAQDEKYLFDNYLGHYQKDERDN